MIHCQILIIDDDEDDIAILIDALYEIGVEKVHYVHSAKEAFLYLEEVHPECLPKVIVTDFYLPMATGGEFLIDIKALNKYREVKVVVLSSVKSEKEMAKFIEMGAADYLAKPTSFDDYVQVATDIKSMAGV